MGDYSLREIMVARYLMAVAIVVCLMGQEDASEETFVLNEAHLESLSVDTNVVPAGKMSMIEIKEHALTAAKGTVSMSEEMAVITKKDIMRLTSGFKTPEVETLSIGATRLPKKLLYGDNNQKSDLGEGVEVKGSGLDLIFRKLDELEKKIINEQDTDLASEEAGIEACRDAILNGNNLITQSSTTRSNNQLSIQECSAEIETNRGLWGESRNLEDQNHDALVDLQMQRSDEAEAISARVDERNKAIDVLVKATFMVCERFNRYKNTPQCMEIKSQPDVDEPQRYETKVYEKAMEQTKLSHKTDGKWDEDWKKQMELDIEKEGIPDPEGNLSADDSTTTNQAADEANDVELLQMDDNDDTTALSQDEQQAVRELTTRASDRELPEKYALPLNELALSLKSGDAKRSKSIVENLLEVLNETRNEQAADKATHNANLNSCYTQSWDLKGVLNQEAATQKSLRDEMEALRLRILELANNNEVERKDQGSAAKAKVEEEDRCASSSEGYGVRTIVRNEDLENLAKLKSLLRALYFKNFPKSCPRHNNNICTSKTNGWCVFTKRDQKSNEQRCSCNVGFYGDACQFKQCPGSGKGLYKSDDEGACSNRGACNRLTGLCHCRIEYYHGPKKACDYAHAPPSKADACDPVCDDACSQRGRLDPIRGVCNCQEEFFGPGCEEKKCPNSNCSCGNDAKGQPFSGPSCEFRSCPFDCTGGGECNRNDGVCICKDGYSGTQCEKTTRCKNENLVNANMNWWTIWDKPGWMVCPKGQLMFQLKRSLCEGLSCIDSGGCAAACEGTTGNYNHVFQLRHCYHDLRWYNSFDMAGTSECMDDYYIAGLFRSCESLYCLNMAKCCSLKEARWSQCTYSNWGVFNGPGTGKVTEHQFMVGLKRSEGHQIKNIDEAKGCGFVRGY